VLVRGGLEGELGHKNALHLKFSSTTGGKSRLLGAFVILTGVTRRTSGRIKGKGGVKRQRRVILGLRVKRSGWGGKKKNGRSWEVLLKTAGGGSPEKAKGKTFKCYRDVGPKRKDHRTFSAGV